MKSVVVVLIILIIVDFFPWLTHAEKYDPSSACSKIFFEEPLFYWGKLNVGQHRDTAEESIPQIAKLFVYREVSVQKPFNFFNIFSGFRHGDYYETHRESLNFEEATELAKILKQQLSDYSVEVKESYVDLVSGFYYIEVRGESIPESDLSFFKTSDSNIHMEWFVRTLIPSVEP